MIGPCPYDCKMKSSMGYCQSTACTNPKYNGSGTWHILTCQYCFKTFLVQDEVPEICSHCGRKMTLSSGDPNKWSAKKQEEAKSEGKQKSDMEQS